jgi:hypothetical protein
MKEKISRKDEMALGLKRYFTGNACKRGHISERQVSSLQCCDCSREKQKLPHVKARKAAHFYANKEKYNLAAKARYLENRDIRLAKASEYQKKNLKRIVAQRETNKRKKIAEQPWLALKYRAKASANAALKRVGAKKKQKTMQLLGCTTDDLKAHIERQFVKGMTWENRHLWHLDHIIPLASAKMESEVLALCHFTNLRPCWAVENIKKSDKREFLL